MKIFAETERLVLREILPTDIDGIYELDSDPDVHRYLGNNTLKALNQASDVINFVRQQYVDYGIGRWAIVDKKSNEFIGWSGLKYVTDITNNRTNYYDLGYRLIKRFWGQGIATETAFIALEYAFNTLKLNEVCAAASYDNNASNRITNKLGFNFVETFYYQDILCNWYEFERSNYDKLRN